MVFLCDIYIDNKVVNLFGINKQKMSFNSIKK